MKQFNLDIIKNEADTQYTDMKGFASIDGHNMKYLFDLCTDNGIDLTNNFLLGLSIKDGEPIGLSDLMITANYIPKPDGLTTYNQIYAYLNSLDKVTIHRKSFEYSYDKLGKYIKRLYISTVSDMSTSIKDAEFVDD